MKGSLEKPEPAGTLAANAATLSAPGLPAPLRDLQLNARIQDGAAHIDTLTALFASARIAATGDMPLPPRQGPGRFHATIDDLDLASIPGMPASLSGHTSARIEGSAAALDLHSLRATLTLPRLEFDAGDQHFEQDGESTIAVENGVATVQRLKLTGTETTLDVSGTAGLEGERPLALDVAGRFDAAILTVASANARAAGATDLKLSIRGPATKPAIMGFIETTDAQVTLADPAIAAENLALRTEFTGDRVDITSLKGDINGGQMRGRGTASIGDGKLSSVNLTATIADAFLEYPRGLKSRANAALALRGDSTALALTGNINVMEGSYRDAITIERGLLGGSSSAASSDLARVRWDVQVRTVSPIAIDNNIARAGVTADLHVVGTPARTALTGRVDLEQGGEVTLGERKYIIERGAIRFTNDQRIEPVLDLEAKTRVSNYDVTLHVEGEPGKKLDTTFTSDPALPEPDVVALVATGRTLEESRGAEADIAKEQLLSYLTAGLGGSLTGRAQQMLGLSQVRIEPSLIAAETEPTARLTLGQDLTRQFGLIYSMNLRDARDQIWVGRYDLTRRFSTRAVRQADNTYRFQFQHDVRFGGKPDPSREPQAFRRSRKIGKVSIETAGAIPEKDAANMLAQRTGRGFDFFRLRKGTDRVRDRLRSRGLLEATLHVDREETESTIDLAVHVKPGPSVQLVFEGWDPPGAVRKSVREAWSAGVFDAQRMRDSTRVLQQGLAAAGFLRGSAKATVSQAREKRVLFEIHPGERFGRIEIRFPGATAIKPRTLARLVKQQKLGAKAQSEPEAVIAAVERLYGEDGFLDARAGPRKIEFTKGTALIDFPVNEGQRYRAGEIRFSGATIPQSDLVDAIQLEDTVTLATGDQALAAVRDLYAARGYNNAEIELALARHPETARVDLDFRIREGTQRVLGELRVEGNEYTSDALIRNQIGIAPGQPVGSLDLSRARRNLYSTGAFALAEVEPQPTGDQVNLVARVREVRPWELRYGAFYDTERGPGGILDFANRNMLGNARVIGLRTRYDSELREARAYFSQPFLRSLPVRTVASTFIRREVAADFITDRNGVVLNEEFRWRGKYTLAAGYRFERAHTFEKQPDPVFPFDVRIRIAPVTATFARETRDDLLDATRGSFLSGAWEWGAAPFGSELSFVKYFGQYFRYFPLTKPALIPWAGVWRPRWVYAAGVRTGLAGGLAGQELVETEHFFAGGGTTVRGFEQNRLGPQLGSHATGGNAVFIMNHELRFPLWRFIDGVSFVDAGNVFARVADFRLSDLRTSAGLGLRLRTPYFVLRLDYGAKIDRRPGESFGRFFFSIGQAF
ncbi:MAG: translocation/assembly module TamB domain-containing protein [Bryobacteraceae bacterium]